MTLPVIIAEAGVNHNGSLDRALSMVDAAARAGADVVKFQSFEPEALVSASAKKAAYQEMSTGGGGQLEMLQALKLDRSAHEALIARCAARGIGFLSTPFDIQSVEMLVSLGVSQFKISSGELTDLPVLRAIGEHASDVLVSTGMASLSEIHASVNALIDAGLRRERITLLHCTTEYPAPFDEVNLRAMVKMGEEFQLPVGYSDHTRGIEVSVAAVALGARVVEKHFTLDRHLPGPDHAASIEPAELESLVNMSRNVARALGASEKRPSESEMRNIAVVRKSIVAARRIEQGETFTEDNLTAKRPGEGLSPMLWDDVVGQVAIRRFEPDELIEL